MSGERSEGGPLVVIEDRFDPHPAVVSELRKALEMAERGELVSVSIAGVSRDDSIVTAWAGGRRITLIGAMRTLEHEMFAVGAGLLSPTDREPAG